MSSKFCQVCAQPVSLKIWTAHVKGRKHLQKIQEAKSKPQKSATSKATSSSASAAPGSKHPLPVPDSDLVSAKKAKVSVDATVAEPASSNSGEVNELAFIPSGFFDDAVQNNKTDAEVAKQKLLDAEYAKFMNEVASAEAEVAIADEDDIKAFTHERQMESIDDTIRYWRAYNELEKRKEAILEKKHAQNGDVVMEDESQAAGNDDSSDDDIDETNWRKRSMF